MKIDIQRNNALVASNAQLVNSQTSNTFFGESFQKTLLKVKAFAEGVLQGVFLAVVIVAICFLAGFGFYKGNEKASEIFSRISGK